MGQTAVSSPAICRVLLIMFEIVVWCWAIVAIPLVWQSDIIIKDLRETVRIQLEMSKNYKIMSKMIIEYKVLLESYYDQVLKVRGLPGIKTEIRREGKHHFLTFPLEGG